LGPSKNDTPHSLTATHPGVRDNDPDNTKGSTFLAAEFHFFSFFLHSELFLEKKYLGGAVTKIAL